MVNLMNDYWEKVEPERWLQLFQVIHQVTGQLCEKIHNSDQPIVKQKSEKALSLLLKTVAANTERAELAA